MPALGEYVHLNGANYKLFGTHRKNSSSSNFDFSIIAKAHQRLYHQIQATKRATDLKAMEDAYNRNAKAQFQAMQKLDRVGRTDLIKKLIEGADGVPNSLLKDQQMIDLLVDNLEFNEEQLNIKFNNNLLKGAQKVLTPFSGSQYSRLATLKDRVQKLKTLAGKIKNYTFPKDVQDILTAVENAADGHEKANKEILTALHNLDFGSQESFFDKDKAWENFFDKDKGWLRESLPANVAQIIYKKLENVEQFLTIKNYETGLQAAFAELLGPVIGHFGIQEAEQAILQQFLQTFQGAGQKSATSQMGGYISLNAASVKAYLQELNSKAKKSVQGMLIKDPNNKFFVDFKMQVGNRSDQKIDATLTFHGEQLNASVKNVDLAEQTFYDRQGNLQTSTISLQKGTSLLSYLIGLNNFQQDLGNHLLNIMAWHGDDKEQGSWLTTMRRQGITLLELQIMWSALTGQYQGRIMPTAQLLYIQDKSSDGSPIIKIYDMVDILTNAYTNGGIDITPDLQSISGMLLNKAVPDPHHPPKYGIASRLTRLMIDIRQRRFSAVLRKSVLKQ